MQTGQKRSTLNNIEDDSEDSAPVRRKSRTKAKKTLEDSDSEFGISEGDLESVLNFDEKVPLRTAGLPQEKVSASARPSGIGVALKKPAAKAPPRHSAPMQQP